MNNTGMLTILARAKGYECSADGGATWIVFGDSAKGRRSMEDWLLRALRTLKERQYMSAIDSGPSPCACHGFPVFDCPNERHRVRMNSMAGIGTGSKG